MVIHIQIEPGCEDLPIPHYQTSGSAGFDLYADVNEEIQLHPGDIRLVSTGIRMAIPHGYEGQVRPRSGLALKHGIGILNAPGTVDSDYRGIVGIILINAGSDSFLIKRGDRIAQMIINKIETVTLNVVHELSESDRASGGFGSTGI